MADGIVRTVEGGVMELGLDRADKKNALTAAMYRALTQGLADAAADGEIAAVLITGAGDAFSAGNDINDFLAPGGAQAAFDFIRAISVFPKPIVAAVQGLAVGVGTTLLLHCDLVYATPDARFIVPFAKLGLVPEAASSLLLPARIGPAKAAAMLLLGDPLDSAGAERAGLVTAIVESDLVGHARGKAEALAQMPPHALAATRKLMRGDGRDIAVRIDEEAEAFRIALAGAEAKEAFSAFLEKRAPVFTRQGV